MEETFNLVQIAFVDGKPRVIGVADEAKDRLL